MVTIKKEVSLLQGDKCFIDKVLSRSSSIGGGFSCPSGRYYAGAHVEVPFIWEQQPGKPKHPQRLLYPCLSEREAERASIYFGGEAAKVPFQWEMQPGKPIHLSEENQYKSDPPPPLPPGQNNLPKERHEEVVQSMCATPGGSARWIRGLFREKLSKKVRRVRSEPFEVCVGRGRFGMSERYFFSDSDTDDTPTSSGSFDSMPWGESSVPSCCSVGPLVHSSKFQVLAKGLAKWIKL